MWQNQQNGCAPSEDTNQASAFAESDPSLRCLQEKKLWSLAIHWAHSKDWSTQANLSLPWVHTHFVGFVMSWLMCLKPGKKSNKFKSSLNISIVFTGTLNLNEHDQSIKSINQSICLLHELWRPIQGWSLLHLTHQTRGLACVYASSTNEILQNSVRGSVRITQDNSEFGHLKKKWCNYHKIHTMWF